MISLNYLYRCDETQADRYQVLFLLNEAPAEISDCRVGLCTWETVRRKWALLADNCNLRNYCLPNAAHTINNNVLGFVLAATACFLVGRFRGM